MKINGLPVCSLCHETTYGSYPPVRWYSKAEVHEEYFCAVCYDFLDNHHRQHGASKLRSWMRGEIPGTPEDVEQAITATRLEMIRALLVKQNEAESSHVIEMTTVKDEVRKLMFEVANLKQEIQEIKDAKIDTRLLEFIKDHKP